MKRIILAILIMIIVVGCSKKDRAVFESGEMYNTILKQDILCIMMGYPEYVIDIEKDQNNKIYIIMKSGKKIIYDDKKIKNHSQKLSNPDLQDMMEQIYPLCTIKSLVSEDFDPGRARVYDLFYEVYGGSKSEIQKNLITISTQNGKFLFNKNNNVANSLKSTILEINQMIQTNKSIYSFVFPTQGTYCYRLIASTGRLSPHSFGIAIDLAKDKRDYWQWASKTEGEKRLSTYPEEIVQVFEKNNFIWGGKWAHFDIMHYEYRPEIILKSKYFGKGYCSNIWYKGVPLDLNTKDYVELIERKLNIN